jgi:hypothetical protein
MYALQAQIRRHHVDERERSYRQDLEMAQRELYEEEQRLETAKDEYVLVREEYARK